MFSNSTLDLWYIHNTEYPITLKAEKTNLKDIILGGENNVSKGYIMYYSIICKVQKQMLNYTI